MNQQLKEHLTSKETWLRGLFMLLFAIAYGLAELVLVVVSVFQFGSKLFTGHPNRRLLNLGQSLATYIYQIVLFLTFRSDERPYPFDAWPKGAPSASKGGASRGGASRPKEGDAASTGGAKEGGSVNRAKETDDTELGT